MNSVSISSLTCGFVVFPGVEELDLVGPWELIALWSTYAGGPEARLMVGSTLEPVRCAKGMSIAPDTDFETSPHFDILIVPGGHSVFPEMENPVFMNFLSAAAKQARFVLSVCTGSFLLQRAGILNGRRATTNWKARDALAALPGIEIGETRWVRDGDIWTAGGVAAGMDMTLAFIAHLAGEAVASEVQLHAEYYPDRRLYGRRAFEVEGPAYFRDLNAPPVPERKE